MNDPPQHTTSITHQCIHPPPYNHPLPTCTLPSHALPPPFTATTTHLEAIVGPGTEFHDTGLLVEGEELHVYLTRGLVNGWRLPLHQTIVVECGLGGECHLEVTISTVRE